MDAKDYAPTEFGRAQQTPGKHGYTAFFPAPIPRSINLTTENVIKMANAEAALGRR